MTCSIGAAATSSISQTESSQFFAEQLNIDIDDPVHARNGAQRRSGCAAFFRLSRRRQSSARYRRSEMVNSTTAPIVGRIRALWTSLRDAAMEGFPPALGTSVTCPIAEWANTTLNQPSHYQLIFPIDTVAVRPATRRRSGGTLSSLMRTGMRCARRTQLKVGLTNANRSLLVLRFWSSMP
jgi:hypothetical protein